MAAKRFVNLGEMDLEGKVVPPGEEGYYYQWWCGLHILCGQERLAGGMYLIRPSYERSRSRGLRFEKGHETMVQLEAEARRCP